MKNNEEKSCRKINSEWIHGLNLRFEMVRVLEENKGEDLRYWISNDFLDMIPSAQVSAKK